VCNFIEWGPPGRHRVPFTASSSTTRVRKPWLSLAPVPDIARVKVPLRTSPLTALLSHVVQGEWSDHMDLRTMQTGTSGVLASACSGALVSLDPEAAHTFIDFGVLGKLCIYRDENISMPTDADVALVQRQLDSTVLCRHAMVGGDNVQCRIAPCERSLLHAQGSAIVKAIDGVQACGAELSHSEGLRCRITDNQPTSAAGTSASTCFINPVSRRPPISLDTSVARVEGYRYTALVHVHRERLGFVPLSRAVFCHPV
jgi:hypothetical protein